jgi:uncharacterized protein (TIGR01777 family)
MDYLITGGSGFIGRKLIDAVLSRGHTANYLGRKHTKELDGRAAFHFWRTDEPLSLSSVPRLNAVVHLAGEPIAQRWNKDVKDRIYRSRIEGTRQLVRAIGNLKHRPSVLVCASAVGYYGDRGDQMLTEYDLPGGDFLAQLCIDWEREAQRATELGLRVVSIRIATVLGRDGGALPKMLRPFRLGIGGKFGNGRQWMSWIHVDDLVRLLLFAAETPCATAALNGSSPNPVTNAEFTKALAKTVHRPAIVPVPRFALRLALGEMSQFLFASQRVLPRATEEAGFKFEYAELNAALAHLLRVG